MFTGGRLFGWCHAERANSFTILIVLRNIWDEKTKNCSWEQVSAKLIACSWEYESLECCLNAATVTENHWSARDDGVRKLTYKRSQWELQQDSHFWKNSCVKSGGWCVYGGHRSIAKNVIFGRYRLIPGLSFKFWLTRLIFANKESKEQVHQTTLQWLCSNAATNILRWWNAKHKSSTVISDQS